MDLSSCWDRYAALHLLVLAVGATVGCQALGGGSSPTNGTLWVSSAQLDFGTAVVGTSNQLTDTLTNGSASSITISSDGSSDPSFQVTAPAVPFTLVPGQTATLTIAFTPRGAGKPSGTVAIKSSAAGGGELDVAVSGRGVAGGKLVASPASLAFGNVQVGQSATKTATLTNSGGTSVTVSQDSVSSGAFTISGLTLPLTLAAGQTASFTITFAPKSMGAVSGSVVVNGEASLKANAVLGTRNPQSKPTSASLSVSGAGVAGGQLAVSPASVSFGNVTVGGAQNQTVALTNVGGTSATISQATVTGAGLSVSGLALPLTLAAGQSSSFVVTFAPASAGAVTGTIAIASTASNSNVSLAVTGTGVMSGALTLSPASLNFGNVQVGSTQSQPATINNSGGTSVTVTKVTAIGAGFSVSALTLPMTLTPGQSSAFTVTFAPQSSGSVSGSIAFASNAPAVSLPLSGSGLSAGALGASPSSVSFGSVQVGNNQAATVTLTNGGLSSVTINQAAASGTGFTLSGISVPLTLAAGQSTSFAAVFSPTSAGAVTGSIAIASTASNPSLSIPLSGTGVTAGALAANPASISFGSVQLGSTQSHSESLSNTGGTAIQISSASITGTGFAMNGLSVPTTLNAGQSLTFNVTFSPSSAGAASGSLALTTNGSVTNLSIALSGTGASPGQLTVTPASSSFGSVTVGTTKSQTATLTASGAGVTVSSVATTNPEFSMNGLSLPLTLAAGQSVSFTLTFSPTASGAASGTITFVSNATNALVAESATGTGTAAPQHSVSLSWTASTSTVVGYKVYRATQSGGPYAVLNSSPDPSTTYTDSNVQAGSTYYYVVTAVDSSGTESAYSNQAQAVVPTP